MVISEDNHTYCQALSSGAVTTWFYDLGLSRLRFEHATAAVKKKKRSKNKMFPYFVWGTELDMFHRNCKFQ